MRIKRTLCVVLLTTLALSDVAEGISVIEEQLLEGYYQYSTQEYNPFDVDDILQNISVEEKIVEIEETLVEEELYVNTWDTKNCLTRQNGRFNGPNGVETYYSLNMKYVVQRLKQDGFEGEYEVRWDGVKTFNGYVMVAADWKIFPYGSIVKTSLGDAIVCDTGEFASNGSGITFDVAVSW